MSDVRVCRWCGGALPAPRGPARPREFCSTGCKNSLHSRLRWLEVERERRVDRLEHRRAEVARAVDRKHALRNVEYCEGLVAQVDAEVARLRASKVAAG